MRKRKTYAFLTSGIMDSLSAEAWHGIQNACRDDDVSFIVVPVKYYGRDFSDVPDKYEYQYEITASFLTRDNIDGMIVAADYIGCLTNRETLMEFMHRLPDVPTVLLAADIEGYAGVSFDNKYGIRDALGYLIEKKQFRNIGMIGGPEGNNDAEERKQAYFECLSEHGIEFQGNWYVEGDLTERSIRAAEELLDSAPELEAIFCVNDATALALYDVMRERGLEPGVDICVFGFDNDVRGSMLNPSLSTIDASTSLLGGYSYNMLKRLVNGEKVGHETAPTRFIKRDSFGIENESVQKTDESLFDKKNINKFFDQIFYRYKTNEFRDSSLIRNNFGILMDELIDIVNDKPVDRGRLRKYSDKVKLFLKNGALDYTDNDELIPYFDKLLAGALNRAVDQEEKRYIYEFMYRLYKQMIKIQDDKYLKYQTVFDNHMYNMKVLVRDSLKFTYANDLSYIELIAHLDWMEIEDAYIYIFDRPIAHMQQEVFTPPEKVMLKASLKNRTPESVPYNRQLIDSNDIFYNEEMRKIRNDYVVMPLYFGDSVYGIMVHNLTEMTFKNGEFLTNQLGTAARMIDILRINNEVQKQLEDNIAVMRKHNIELDKLSRNDVLTGILNRRGFRDIANGMIRDNRLLGNTTLVAYVDMNNLKIINDRFGHEEGDFSLKTISRIISDVIDDKGVVGRIGGDEYAFIYYGTLDEKELADRIRITFEDFNAGSDKPYNISVSCGFCRIDTNNPEMSLEEAMSEADRDLYIAKQNKDNRIVKVINTRRGKKYGA
ncbi:MAG: diguanylate cyclase [Eubacterium sp.]|nr:diguanylate cyclase [Eubacterium sp.]